MRLVLTLLLTLCLCAPVAARGEAVDPVQANRLLQAELELAKSQQLYFLFDLPAAKIEFRVSGVAVATLPILEMRSWGRIPDGVLYALAKRTATKEPVREQIAIPDGKEEQKPKPPPAPPKPGEPPKPPELQALEITDMPTDYTLQLDDGTLLTVHADPAEGEQPSAFRRKLERWKWFVSRALFSISHHRQGNEYNEVLMTLPEREARMLYWSFQEGGRCLVLWP